MLIENSNRNTGTWKTVEKKTSALNSKINSTNYETIALKNRFNALVTGSNEFNEVTKNEEINDNVTIDKNNRKLRSKTSKQFLVIEFMRV